MKKPKVITHAGLTIDLLQIKCFRIGQFKNKGNTKIITVEFKTRYEFIQHPETGKYEKQEFNETTEMEFPDYETAMAYMHEWIEIWQDYLDDTL